PMHRVGSVRYLAQTVLADRRNKGNSCNLPGEVKADEVDVLPRPMRGERVTYAKDPRKDQKNRGRKMRVDIPYPVPLEVISRDDHLEKIERVHQHEFRGAITQLARTEQPPDITERMPAKNAQIRGQRVEVASPHDREGLHRLLRLIGT